MSEKMEHRRRLNEKLNYIQRYELWLLYEPPMYRLIAWHRWKKNRPMRREDHDRP